MNNANLPLLRDWRSIQLALLFTGALRLAAAAPPIDFADCLYLIQQTTTGTSGLVAQAAAVVKTAAPPPGGLALAVISGHTASSNAGDCVVQLYPVSARGHSAEAATKLGLRDELLGVAGNTFGVLQRAPTWCGTPANLAQRQRAWRAAFAGEFTFLREQTVAPLRVVAVLPDAAPYLPHSVRDRVRSIVVDVEFRFDTWHTQLVLLTDDDHSAGQVRELVLGWRELAVSLAETFALHPAQKPLRDALEASSVSVVLNQVSSTIGLPAAATVHALEHVLAQPAFAPLVESNNRATVVTNLDTAAGADSASEPWPVSATPADLPALLAAAQDAQPARRRRAVLRLQKFPTPPAIAALLALLHDNAAEVRAAAVDALSHLQVAAALAEFQRLARTDTSALVRAAAVHALGASGDRSTLAAVVNALRDEDRLIRERVAVAALEQLADTTAAPRLRVLLQTDPPPPARRLLIYLLGCYSNPANVPPVQQALTDADPLIRAEAARALPRLRAPAAAAAVAVLLADADEHVRGTAAYALGLLGDQAAREQLRPLLTDPEPFVRAAAAEALQRLGEPGVAPPPGFKAEAVFSFPLRNVQGW